METAGTQPLLLLVDDEREILVALTDLLEDRYRILSTTSPVEAQMRCRLARVEHGQRAHAAGEGDELRDGVHDAEHVRHVREGDDLGALADEVGCGVQVEHAVVEHGDVAQARPGAGGELLPGDEVRVVLDRRRDDLVTGGEGEVSRCRGPAPESRSNLRPCFWF